MVALHDPGCVLNKCDASIGVSIIECDRLLTLICLLTHLPDAYGNPIEAPIKNEDNECLQRAHEYPKGNVNSTYCPSNGRWRGG